MVIFLGTNDLKLGVRTLKGIDIPTIAQRVVDDLVTKVVNYNQNLNILVISPPLAMDRPRSLSGIVTTQGGYAYDIDSKTLSEAFASTFQAALYLYNRENSKKVQHIALGLQMQPDRKTKSKPLLDMSDSEDGIHITQKHCETVAKLVFDKIMSESASSHGGGGG